MGENGVDDAEAAELKQAAALVAVAAQGLDDEDRAIAQQVISQAEWTSPAWLSQIPDEMWMRLLNAPHESVISLVSLVQISRVNSALHERLGALVAEAAQRLGPTNIEIVGSQEALEKTLTDSALTRPIVIMAGDQAEFRMERQPASGQLVSVTGPGRVTVTHDCMVKALQDSKVTVKDGGRVEAQEGSSVTVESGGEASGDSGSFVTVNDGGTADAFADSFMTVNSGGVAEAYLNSSVTVTAGGLVKARKGTSVTVVGGAITVKEGKVLIDGQVAVTGQNGNPVPRGAVVLDGEGHHIDLGHGSETASSTDTDTNSAQASEG